MTLNKTAGRSIALLAAVLLLSGIVYAQRGGGRFFGGGRFVPFQIPPNQKYDGRFTFVRVKYETAPGGYWWRGQHELLLLGTRGKMRAPRPTAGSRP